MTSKVSVAQLSGFAGATRESDYSRHVGPTYGRKMMTGYLKYKGVHACEERVGKALQAIQPQNHEARQHGARNLNPTPYRADYMGQKIHIDQNEKMVMYGVTHVVAIDGFSGKLVAHSTMPIKNNLTIYDEIYRKAVLEHGMWDQIRVDCGTEFYLTLFMQEKLAGYRYNQSQPPFLQTPSTLNHRIERVWPEVNNRVNYPIKRCLMNLEDQEIINFGDDTVKFCISTLA
ncbi:uncharacterized protein LOC114847823 [Betta splendens]|uniref:Uncharacterized protein LOC114847823 n=1 Tax=Betta splendens TaxID=158456 RepID=A0A9W2XGM5_BETSP|nr:uncharacterized protein LOC114847823 [Betta splendens]